MGKAQSDWTVLSMLEWATGYFEDKEVRNPRLSIEWLLAHVLEKKRLDLYLIFDKPLSIDELNKIRPLVKRRATHEPLQYITGETEFFGFPFSVKPGVLIPRQETEQLVELVLNTAKKTNNQRVLDIGTGSGCIPITLKKINADWNVSAIDISEDALEIAIENAQLNETEIDFSLNDVFNPNFKALQPEYDIIVSNPPYVLDSERETLDLEVKNYEPSLALFTQSTQKIYGAIEQFARKLLNQNGFLALEINERFGTETERIFSEKNWNVSILKDYSQKDRFVLAKKVK